MEKAIQFPLVVICKANTPETSAEDPRRTLEAILSMFGDRIGRLPFKQTVNTM